MSWKDDYRERKDASGKTWDEFAETELHHEDDLDNLRSQVESLTAEVDALADHCQALRRKLGEIQILVEDEPDE